MSEQEFQVMDEVYFICSFEAIQKETGIADGPLLDTLERLIGRGYINAMKSEDNKLGYVRSLEHSRDQLKCLSYLATRQGLIEHHRIHA